MVQDALYETKRKFTPMVTHELKLVSEWMEGSVQHYGDSKQI
jgi:hypothetical protein